MSNRHNPEEMKDDFELEVGLKELGYPAPDPSTAVGKPNANIVWSLARVISPFLTLVGFLASGDITSSGTGSSKGQLHPTISTDIHQAHRPNFSLGHLVLVLHHRQLDYCILLLTRLHLRKRLFGILD